MGDRANVRFIYDYPKERLLDGEDWHTSEFAGTMNDYEAEEQFPLPMYTEPDALQFVEDMRDIGLNVEHYHGRSFWHGPAVRVDGLQDAMSYTRVPVQWDNMGRGYIVYPWVGDVGTDQ